jgi:electron transfer flavoprotein alpha subunit
MLANNPHPTSMPPLNNSTRPTIVSADATAVVPDKATAVAISHNNQPGLAAAELAHSNPLVLLIPTSIGKIGTIARRMAVTLKTGTRAQCVGIGAQHTILTQSVPTSWADWLPECTRPSYRRCVAALHPPVIAPSSSSAHSNAHWGHTTQPNARLPHSCSLEECNLPAAPTTNGRP